MILVAPPEVGRGSLIMRGRRASRQANVWVLAKSAATLLCLLVLACGGRPAVEELREGVLFYPWTHGSTLSGSPERVAEITRTQLRALREIEDFAGTLDEWRSRSGSVERLQVGRDDYALDRNIFFYCLASLERPAVAENLQLRITRKGPDGTEIMDLVTQAEAQMNRRAQSAGILYSMAGLAPGEHRLHVEVLDGDDVAASGDLWVDYHPGSWEVRATEGEATP